MDKYELKYKWEENKRNILAGAGLVAGLALIGGGIFMMTQNFFYDETAGPEIILADSLLTHNNEGQLDLYQIEEDKHLDTIALPETFLLGSNQNLDQTYVYDKDKGALSRVEVDKDKLSYEEVHTFDESIAGELKEAVAFETTDEQFAFYTPDAFYVVDDKMTTHTIPLEEEVEVNAWSLGTEGLYYAEGDHLAYVDLASKAEERVELGDKTSRIHGSGRSVMVHNNFGSKLGKSVLFRLQPNNLHIEEIKNIDSFFFEKPRVPADENQIVYLDIERNEEGTAIRKQLIVQNAVSVEDEEVNKPTVMELTATGEFKEDHTLASNGFLYNYEEGEYVGVSEIRNGRQYKAVTVKNMNEKLPYFLPVYNK